MRSPKHQILFWRKGEGGGAAYYPVAPDLKMQPVAILQELKNRLESVVAICASSGDAQHQIQLGRGGPRVSILLLRGSVRQWVSTDSNLILLYITALDRFKLFRGMGSFCPFPWRGWRTRCPVMMHRWCVVVCAMTV